MLETGILMGLPPANGPGSGARIVIVFVMSASLLIALISYLMSGGWSGVRTDAPDALTCPTGWLWGWAVLLLFNLPLPLLFGFGMTSGAGTFGMLAGVGVVWLIGHLAIARVSEIRDPLLVGGIIVALSQVIPVAHIFAGALALAAITGSDVKNLDSAPAGFAVTLLTAALLAVVALMIGFVLCAVVGALEAWDRRSGRSLP